MKHHQQPPPALIGPKSGRVVGRRTRVVEAMNGYGSGDGNGSGDGDGNGYGSGHEVD